MTRTVLNFRARHCCASRIGHPREQAAKHLLLPRGVKAIPGHRHGTAIRGLRADVPMEPVEITPMLPGDEARRGHEVYAELAELAGSFIHEIKNHLSTLGLNLQLLAEDFQE